MIQIPIRSEGRQRNKKKRFFIIGIVLSVALLCFSFFVFFFPPKSLFIPKTLSGALFARISAPINDHFRQKTVGNIDISNRKKNSEKTPIQPLSTISVPTVIVNSSSEPASPTVPPFAIIQPAAVSRASVNYKFGMSVGDTLSWVSDDELGAELNDVVSLGIGWLRFDIDWGRIQPNNSSDFEWGKIDRLVGAANSRNIKLLPVISYTPAWARPENCKDSDKCAPAVSENFATFAAAAVARYSSQGIHIWEIWNEPNSSMFWKPKTNSLSYSQLLKVTYAAIKKQDPAATVVSGGMAPVSTNNGDISPVDFLSQLYQQGAKSYFDAVGHHPYCYPVSPSVVKDWSAWSEMADNASNLRKIMAVYGDSAKQIWLTEFGAPTGGPGTIASENGYGILEHPDHVTEGLQAIMFSDAMTLVKSYSWAGPLFIYSYHDLGTSADTNENFFGIIRYDGTTKPAYNIIKNAALSKK